MISLREEREALRRASAPVLTQIGRDAAAARVHQVRELLGHLVVELFSVELTVATWMEACRLPLENGSTLFHTEMGTPPESYLWDRRLETSAGLLLDTDFESGQIAAMVCCSNKRAYKRRFQSWSGLTPDAFRREIQRLPGLLTGSGESLLSGHFLDRLLGALLTKEEAGELIGEIRVRNRGCWTPPIGPLERFFAREIWENVVVSEAEEYDIALFELCFKTPALREHVERKARKKSGKDPVDDEYEDDGER